MNKLKTYVLSAGALLLFILASVLLVRFLESNKKEPCPYEYTVDLTGYEKLVTGSYLYKGLIIPSELWAVYEYKMDDFSKRISAQPHVRGCACSLKSCVKFCCTIEKYNKKDSCLNFTEDQTHSTKMNITTSSGELNYVDLTEMFVIQNGSGCFNKFYLEPHKYSYDAFSLFEDGKLLMDNKIHSKDEYCLSYYHFKNSTHLFPTPMVCSSEQPVDETFSIFSAITMLSSAPFFILTAIVYLAIPELRTLHGMSLCCHLLGLSFAYSLLAKIILTPQLYHTDLICKVVGFSTYFSFMFSYCWIGVISFHLYYNIHAPRVQFNKSKRFIVYSVFAWGLALILLSLTIIAEHSELIPKDLKPGISNNSRCWFDGIHGWTQLVYFYTPMAIIIVFCVVMFTLTSLKIYGIQNEMDRMMEQSESQKNIRNERDRFAVFLRLFFVMGVPWTLEIFNNLLGRNTFLAISLDFILGIQGLVIFALFVLTKKVRKYITKRFSPTSNSEPQSQDSNKTQVSSSPITLKELGAYKRAEID